MNTIREVVTKWIYLSRVFSTTRAGHIEQLGFGNKVLFPTHPFPKNCNKSVFPYSELTHGTELWNCYIIVMDEVVKKADGVIALTILIVVAVAVVIVGLYFWRRKGSSDSR